MGAPPSLVWVLVAGEPRHVSSLAHLRPRDRPLATCPQCDRRMTLKLGDVLQHHAAHAPGDICVATRPESALHINCKFALAAAMTEAAGPDARLSVLRTCAGDGRTACENTSIDSWLESWDSVLVEHRLGDARRPDIVLSRDGRAIGAVEIVVTNPVSPDKAVALTSLGVPWAEVRGAEQFATPGGWSAREPLPIQRLSGDVWRCRVHAAQYRVRVDAAAETRAERAESDRHASVLRAARVVDLYHTGGVRERFIYRITKEVTDGRAHALQLRRGRLVVAAVAVTAEGNTLETAWPELRIAFAADVKRMKRNAGSFGDSPMRWATGDAAENIIDEAMTDRAGNDPTPLATRYPRRWFYAKGGERWFLPEDMRDVTWDCPALDAFAAHPAWTRNHAAVHERPAPEGSWQTPVFASRPTAVMFLPAPATYMEDAAIGVLDCTASSGARRAIVVIERAVSSAAIEAVITSLDDDRADAVWLSHPLDWHSAMSSVAWAPSGRDARGRGGVVVDGVGVFRAAQFLRAVIAGNARVSPDAIRRSMAARVQRMTQAMPRTPAAPAIIASIDE